MNKEDLKSIVIILLAMIIVCLVALIIHSNIMLDLQWELIELQTKRIDQLVNSKLK